MVKLLGPTRLTIDREGQWKPVDGPKDPIYMLSVEYSRSGRARCRRCSEPIPNKSIRIGTPIKWRGGEHGYISSWAHLECSRVESEVDSDEIHGFDDLTKEDQKSVKAELAKTEPPAHIKTIDPTDPEFLKKKVLPREKAPQEITAPLLPFQEEGIGWMRRQEASEVKGGILADEMGMGKTVQTISMIVAAKIAAQEKKEERAPTLVICPTSAMLQWAEEVDRFTSKGTLSVFAFYKDRMDVKKETLMEYDVVLTTFPVVEYEYRRLLDLHKVVCEYCGGRYLKRTLIVHQRFFCGPDATRSEKLAKREKKNKEAAVKAMRTLNITTDEPPKKKGGKLAMPTPSNIYRELMLEANRRPLAMYEKAPRDEDEEDEKKVEKDDDKEDEEEEKPISAKKKPAPNKKKISVRSTKLSSSSSSSSSSFSSEIEDVIKPTTNAKKNSKKKGKEETVTKATKKQKTNKGKSIILEEEEEEEQEKEEKEEEEVEEKEEQKKVHKPPKKRGIRMSSLASLSTRKAARTKQKARRSPSRSSSRSPSPSPSPPRSAKKGKGRKTPSSSSSSSSSFSAEMEAAQPIKPEKETETKKQRGKTPRKTPTKKGKVAEKAKDEEDEEEEGKDKKKANTRKRARSPSPSPSPEPPKTKGGKKKTFAEITSAKKTTKKPAKKTVKLESEEEEEEAKSSESEEEKPEKNSRPKRQRKQVSYAEARSSSDDDESASSEDSETESESESESDSEDEKPKKKGAKKKSTSSSKKEASPKKKAPTKSRNGFETLSKGSSGDLVKRLQKALKITADGKFGSKTDKAVKEYQKKKKLYVDGVVGPRTWAMLANVSQAAPKKRRAKPGTEEEGEVDDDDIDYSSSIVHSIHWRRIILDEAHKIKARTTNTAKSVYALKSDFKWCLTGTPLQNRVGELYSLVRFLRMEPFSCYYCSSKGCDCKSMAWMFGEMQRRCAICQHPPMQHYSYFNKFIINPIKRYGYVGDGRKGMLVLKDKVLDSVMLRRTKVERASDLSLPPLRIEVAKLDLGQEERDFYDCIYKQTRSQFDKYVNKGTLLHNYAHIFDLLARLRQAVNHPYLVIHGNSASTQTYNRKTKIPSRSAGSSDICGVCQEDIELKDVSMSSCQHTFHRNCIKEYMEELGDGAITCPVCYVSLTIAVDLRGLEDATEEAEKLCTICMEKPMDAVYMDCGHAYTCMDCTSKLPTRKCPICREPIKKVIKAQSSAEPGGRFKLGAKNILQQVDLSQFASSTKVDAVVDGVKRMPKHAKAIVFSQYTSMLDIIEYSLRKAGIKTVKLVGSMPMSQRRSVLQAFRIDESITVILLSLKAGGEGLNLQVASHVFVMDPWWNPAVEMQAIQRAHRIGQTKEVVAVRFITNDTIEERMFQLQEKKQLVFSSTIDANASAMAELTQEDMRFLFSN